LAENWRNQSAFPRSGADSSTAKEPPQIIPAPAPVEAPDLSSWVARFARAYHVPASLEETMHTLLLLACDLTGRHGGLLGVFDRRGHLAHRITCDLGVEIPEGLLQMVRGRSAPWLQDTAGERASPAIVAPLGHSEGVLMLVGARPDAIAGEPAVALTREVGAFVWGRLREAMETRRLESELARLRREQSPAIAAVLACARLSATRLRLKELALTAGPVFLEAEEGSETEDLARYLHAESPRGRDAKFVAFRPSGIAPHHVPQQMLQCLHEAGAPIPGGARGVLFLVGPELLPLDAQQSLAEALRQEGAARLVATSTASVADLVHAGRLDPALAACLETRIAVPPLRAQPADIPALVELILREMGSDAAGQPRVITDRALRPLQHYPWPRNVAELREVLGDASGNAGTDPISAKHLPKHVREAVAPPARFASLREVEKAHITAVMNAVRSKREVAKILGIAASTLYEKLDRLQIGRPARRPRSQR
jgi:hypothetical protein